MDNLMKSVHRLLMRTISRVHKGERGMTGLETAIILIAFVTVAAVFGYAVLSAGIFTTEQAKGSIYAGMQEAKSSMELKGSAIGYGAPTDSMTIDDCNTASNWTAETDVLKAATIDRDNIADQAIKISLEEAFTTGLAAYGSQGTVDLSDYTALGLWMRVSADVDAEDLQLKLYSDASANSSAIETLNLPALYMDDGWTHISLTLQDPSGDTIVQSVGLSITRDIGAIDIYVDDIVAGPYSYIAMVEFSVANAVAGEPVDLTPCTGVSSDNTCVISYTDQNIYRNNVNWSVHFIGSNDGDELLEMGEQAQIKVPVTSFTGNTLTKNKQFTIELKPPHGAVVTVQHYVPENVDAVMELLT